MLPVKPNWESLNEVNVSCINIISLIWKKDPLLLNCNLLKRIGSALALMMGNCDYSELFYVDSFIALFCNFTIYGYFVSAYIYAYLQIVKVIINLRMLLVFHLLILVRYFTYWYSWDLGRSSWKCGPLCALWKQCWKAWIWARHLCQSLLALLWSIPDWEFLLWWKLPGTMVFIS